MSAPPKKIAQPMNREPSNFIWHLPGAQWGLPATGPSRGSFLVLQDPLLMCPARLDVRVVQVEGGPLGADARDAGEVVPRRRAGRRPLQRVPVAPRVVHGDLLAVLPGLVDVVEEEERGRAQDPRADA